MCAEIKNTICLATISDGFGRLTGDALCALRGLLKAVAILQWSRNIFVSFADDTAENIAPQELITFQHMSLCRSLCWFIGF